MSNLKWRVAIIAATILLSLWALRPEKVVKRSITAEGLVTQDTVLAWPPKKGLDLQGGMHISLEIDESAGVVVDKAEAIERALRVVRNRIDQFGVAEPNIQTVGDDRIIVELPGVDDPERAENLVKQAAFLEFQITDNTGLLDRAMPRIDAAVRSAGVRTNDVRGDTATRPRGIAGLLSNAQDTTKGDSATGDTAVLGTGVGGPFSSLLQPGGSPGQYVVAAKDAPTVRAYLALPQVKAAIPPGKELLWQADSVVLGGQPYRALYVVDERPIITGEALVDARPSQDPVEGTLVQFRLNNEGGRVFKRETGRYIKRNMAIVLDEQVMGEPPVIQDAIGTRGQITMGRKDLQAAQDLALVLRAGSLPVKMKVAQLVNIGASLGEDAIRQGLAAGALGVALVILIMVVYYRFSGFLAVLGLLFYALVTLAILAGFDATLTLPGLAGFVLSIGMAVDANFLIFERIREELERGKTIRTSIIEGFEHAWSAIIDTHVTTALTAAILYQFGTGPVQGFAVALLAGLAASLMSAIFVVKTLFLLWLRREQAPKTLSI